MKGNSAAVWRCKQGHTLGLVRRNGRGIRQLIILREAIDPRTVIYPDRIAEVDVIAVVEGFTPTVRCSICGNVRTWVPGKEAIEAMVKRMKGKTLER